MGRVYDDFCIIKCFCTFNYCDEKWPMKSCFRSVRIPLCLIHQTRPFEGYFSKYMPTFQHILQFTIFWRCFHRLFDTKLLIDIELTSLERLLTSCSTSSNSIPRFCKYSSSWISSHWVSACRNFLFPLSRVETGLFFRLDGNLRCFSLELFFPQHCHFRPSRGPHQIHQPTWSLTTSYSFSWPHK